MECIIQVIDKRCAEQVKRADDLLKVLETFGWKDTRPKRINARKERSLLLDFHDTIEVPASTLIPSDFIRDYHEWYSGVLALVEGNIPSRTNEVIALHEGIKEVKDALIPMIRLLQSPNLTFEMQVTLASHISHMQVVSMMFHSGEKFSGWETFAMAVTTLGQRSHGKRM